MPKKFALSLLMAFQAAFIFVFFLGIFNNSTKLQVYTDNTWYFLGRGYPGSWAGVGLADHATEFPVITAPFLTAQAGDDTFTKVIDLSVFVPFFCLIWLIFLPFCFLIYNLDFPWPEAKTLFPLLHFFLLLGCIFFYFFWFPTV